MGRERNTKGRRRQGNAGKHGTYETLAGESTETLTAEGEPYKWEWEWEAAKIAGMAEGTSGMFELAMKVAEVT